MSDVDVIHLLKEYTHGQVYGCAPRLYVLRGVDYYKAGRFLGYAGAADGTLLAYVKGAKRYTVEVSEHYGRLRYICDCPAWTLSSNCKHVVCALLSLIDIAGKNGSSAEKKEAGESGAPKASGHQATVAQTAGSERLEAERRYSFLIVPKDGFPDIRLLDTGAEVRRDQWEMPSNLRWVVASWYDPVSRLKNFLLRAENLSRSYPVMFRNGDEDIWLRYKRDCKYAALTGFDASDTVIEVEKLLAKEGGIRDGLIPVGPLVVDLSARTFSEMGDTSGWRVWENFAFSYYPDTVDDDYDENANPLVPTDPEGTTLLFFSGEEGDMPRDLVLKVNGTETSPECRVPSYRLMITKDDDIEGYFALRAAVELGRALAMTFPPLFRYFSGLAYGLPQPLRAYKRKEVLVRAFFEMLSTPNKQDSLWCKISKELDLEDYAVKRKAKRLLEEHLSSAGSDPRIVLFHDGKWIAAAVDIVREGLLYKIPYEVFGWEIFRDARGHDQMRVEAGILAEKLPILYQGCMDAGISLYYEGKLVRETGFDFSFDVSASSGIDWFEIRPEIRCDGTALTEEEIHELLNCGGTIHDTGCVRIMDSNARRVFSALSAIYQAGNGTLKGKKEIVKVPRLRILDWVILRKNGVKVKLPPAEEELISRLTSFERIEPRELPEGINARLRNYQKEGYAWLSFLYENGFGACLADDMGLGKTLQAICLLSGIKEGKVEAPDGQRNAPHLVVLPPSLLFNWENEIGKFAAGLRIFFYAGKERTISFEGYDIVLTTYGLVRRDIEKLQEIAFDVIVFDEAQAVKNIHADTTGAVRKLKGRFKLAMTGTPLENHIGEYYSLIDLAIPGLLGEYDDFRPMIKSEASPVLDLIIKRTRPFVLRRTKGMILKELPPKVETDIYLDLTEKQKALYVRTAAEIKGKIDRAYRTKTKAQASIIALTAILKLRQICVAPALVSSPASGPSPKIEFLIGRLKELLDEGHSALVFSQFTSFLDILERDLAKNQMRFRRLDGSTQVSKRKKLVEGFQSGEGESVFLLSLKAGGQGLNLTRASYVFHLDPWWNPAVENQASDRAHRIGQKKVVNVTRVLMRHTIEEKMMALKEKKAKLYQAVMDGAVAGKKALLISKEDFDFLLN
ncbi:MAG: SNF2-related protein [Acidobacteriota bacterium]